MDSVQGTLGEVLLLLGSLAVVLFALIVLLLEARLILRLGGTLHGEWRSAPRSTRKLPPPPDNGSAPEHERHDDGTD